MAIQYPVEPGTILICDYSRGFVPPEMIKRRPVIVISPRMRTGKNVCVVVPLSTTSPKKVEKYHKKISINPTLPHPFDSTSQWVKCDMINTVSFDRLDLPRIKRDQYGKRKYLKVRIDEEDLIEIREIITSHIIRGA